MFCFINFLLTQAKAAVLIEIDQNIACFSVVYCLATMSYAEWALTKPPWLECQLNQYRDVSDIAGEETNNLSIA
jgi:hypothetical protein